MDYVISEERLEDYRKHLRREERSLGTIEKYIRDLRTFRNWLGEEELTKECAAGWKDALLSKGYASVTINSMLSAVNGFFNYMGWHEFHIRFLRVQRRIFREPSRELSKEEYRQLLTTAREKGKERLALLMETVCVTGIRVSEVRYITVEAAKKGKTEIFLKGKIRMVFLPARLCKKLLRYAGKNKIYKGKIFITKSGQGLSRCQIWQEMKGLCAQADVEATKVFPHNLRHLFATVFYKACRDIVQLADILGHSSIETTRIYLVSTGQEHARRLNQLGLIL